MSPIKLEISDRELGLEGCLSAFRIVIALQQVLLVF